MNNEQDAIQLAQQEFFNSNIVGNYDSQRESIFKMLLEKKWGTPESGDNNGQ